MHLENFQTHDYYRHFWGKVLKIMFLFSLLLLKISVQEEEEEEKNEDEGEEKEATSRRIFKPMNNPSLVLYYINTYICLFKKKNWVSEFRR